MEEIKVRILENGRAREVNDFITKATWNEKEDCYDYSHWEQEAESKLREFDIVNRGETVNGKLELFFSGLGGTEKIKLAELGSIHSARVEGDKVVII